MTHPIRQKLSLAKTYSEAEWNAFNQGKAAFIDARLNKRLVRAPEFLDLALAVAFQCGVVAEHNDYVLITGEQ